MGSTSSTGLRPSPVLRLCEADSGALRTCGTRSRARWLCAATDGALLLSVGPNIPSLAGETGLKQPLLSRDGQSFA